MSQQENALLNSPEVDQLVIAVEEATRATKDTPKRFIEPARGTLDRAKSRRHHIVFGRRGSGKTSLLRKAGADLTLRRVPTAFIDLEAFKGHTFPDVLLSVLIETLNAFDTWLATAGTTAKSNKRFWRFFGRDPDRPPLDRKKLDQVRQLISAEIASLKVLLHSEDDAELIQQIGASAKTASQGSSSVAIKNSASLGTPGVKIGAALDAKEAAEHSQNHERKFEHTEKSRRNKIDILHRKIIDFQKIFDAIVELSGGDAFIFLDDLYHLKRTDQSHVLDYFHRIVKGRSVWLKIGTIRHRTDWYHHGNPPTGLKLGDDCDDIDLDITLENMKLQGNSSSKYSIK
jgi:hypothetical protein